MNQATAVPFWYRMSGSHIPEFNTSSIQSFGATNMLQGVANGVWQGLYILTACKH